MGKKIREYDLILDIKKRANKEIAALQSKEAKHTSQKKAVKITEQEKQLIKLYRTNPTIFEGYLKAI